jgi:cold shock CspA family protein
MGTSYPLNYKHLLFYQPAANEGGFFIFDMELFGMPQYTGQLKFWSRTRASRSFGFICRDNSDVQDFLHISALHAAGVNVESLQDGVTRFAYDLAADERNQKTKCVNVKLID